MSVKSASTRRIVAETVLSGQTRSYRNATTNSVVITGAAVSSTTIAALDIPTIGQVANITSLSSGAVTAPLISNITYLDVNNSVTSAIAVSTSGGNIQITGSGFNANDTVYINNLPVSKTFINSTTVIASVSAGAASNISLAIFNTANIGSQSNSMVRLSGAPTWVTPTALSLYNGIASNVALASSTDSTATYSLKAGSGSLPTGISLLSAGYLTGTASGYTTDTVVSFVLIVTDAEGQAAQQLFNLTVFIGDTYFPLTTLLLQGDVGTTFISDASTNNFLVSRVGDTRPSRFSPYWPGGWSGYFPANGSYLTGSNAIFNVSSGTVVWSFEGWIYPISSGTFFAIGSGGVWGNSFSCEWGLTANKFVFTQSNGSSAPVSITSSGTYTSNQWYHYAVTKDGSGVIRLFVNGSQQGTQTYTSAVASGTTFVINGRYDNNGLGNTGGGFYISNLRFVRNTALYTANFTPSTTSLTTTDNLALLALRDPILVDNSPYGHTITRTGNASLTTFSPFNTTPHTVTANSYSVYFDGTTDTVYTANASTTATAFGSSADFTMEFWLYPLAHDADFDAYVSAGTATIGYYPGTGRGIIYNVADGSAFPGTYKITSGSSAPALNTWSHIAAVRSGGVVKLYLNGTQIGNSYTDTFNHGNGQIIIGSNSTGGSAYQPNCYISNFRIVKGTAVYTANFTVPTAPLTAIANTSFLSGNSSSIADNGPNALALTINGNSRASAFNPFGETVTTISNYTWSANSYGASAYFDGSGDYVTIAANAAMTLGTNDHTIECWVYPVGTQTTYSTIWAYANNTPNQSANSYYLNLNSTSPGSLLLGTGSASWAFNISLTWRINEWNHIAVVRSGNVFTVYVNGARAGSATYAANITSQGANSFEIGGQISGTGNLGGTAWTGYIADFRVVNGTAIYTTPFIPPTAPLPAVANTTLLTLQNDTGSNSVQFVDQSPHNHLITRSGNASQGSYSPLNPTSWSAYFDGTGDYVTLPAAFNGAMGNGWAGGLHTVECWVYPTSWNSANSYYHGIYGTYAGVAANGRWTITIMGQAGNAAGKLNFSYTTSTSTQVDRPSTSFNISLNTWTHIAVTVDASTSSSSTVKFFVNGTLTDTFTAQNLSSQTSNYTAPNIAGNMSQYINDFVGYISNFRHSYNSLIYTANFTPSTATLQPVSTTAILAFSGPRLTTLGPGQFELTRAGDTRIVPFGPHSPSVYTPRGYGIYFDGTSDYLTMPSAAATQFTMGTGDFTIEMWINVASLASTRTLFDSNNNGDSSGVGRLGLWVTAGGVIQLYTTTGSVLTSGGSIKVNNWYHVAYSRESGSGRLFVNGVQVNSTYSDSTNYTCGNTNRPIIGINGFDSSTNPMFGVISNLRIVKGIAIYNTNFAVSALALSAVANTSVLTGHTTSIVDSSSNSLTITVNGNAGPVNLNPFGFDVTNAVSYNPSTMGGSAYFDGTGDDLQTASGNFIGGTLSAARTFTIECWVYHNAYTSGTNGVVIGEFMTTGVTNNWSFGTNSSGQVVLYWYDGAGKNATGNTVIPLYSWAHIALSVAAGAIRLFVNGQIQTITGTSTLTTATGSLGYLAMGRYNTSTVFNGYISNLRVLNGQALYTTSFLLPTTVPSLSSTTSLLLPFTNSGVIDSSGRNVVEAVADARVVTSTKKYSSGSYYFDGTGDYLRGNETLILPSGTEDFTIELWHYKLATGTQYFIIGEPNGCFTFEVTATNIGIGRNNVAFIAQPSYSEQLNTWVHFAVTKASNVYRIFVNGTQVGTNTTDTNSLIAGPYRIGISSGNNGPLNGYIDDLRVTRGYARYTANFTPPTDRHVPQ